MERERIEGHIDALANTDWYKDVTKDGRTIVVEMSILERLREEAICQEQKSED